MTGAPSVASAPVVAPAGGQVGRRLVHGLLSGVAGGLAMSVSTNAEMRVRGRPPSVAPVQALERLLGIDLPRGVEETLSTVGHVVTSSLLGTARGLFDGLQIPPATRDGLFAVLAYLPDFALLPAAGQVPPPWRWSATELTVSTVHHGVYAGVTLAAYSRLTR